MIRTFALTAILFASQIFAWPAFAAQQLMPAPYPGQLGGNAQESQPSGSGGGAHQELVPEPAPQAKGPDALDDPRPITGSEHQQMAPHPYRRQDWCGGASSCSIER
ncbi:MAG TPA: hypothetical protein VGB93_06705 [Methylovirgula sp.]